MGGTGDRRLFSEAKKVAVLCPALQSKKVLSPAVLSHKLEELVGLAGAIHLDVIYRESLVLRQIKPATLFGSGTLETLHHIFKDKDIDLVIVDGALSPIQQRNLERAWKTKVIDRTGLILEIFGARARTAEGRLQVELAALTYAKSRLVRCWTHLERQRGGLGFIGGPGETQIEIDRRLIAKRLSKLSKELEQVKKTRELHRQARRKVPFPIVALVGYTNAGKSTLFNTLTASDVFAEDLLFATLDPTMRAVTLPSGQKIILSDTVGFISDLPTQLIAAFRATLEEVLEADLVLHVRDISHPETEAQNRDVQAVLTELGLEAVVEEGLLEALNKIDLVEDLGALPPASSRRCLLSALTGEGVPDLIQLIEGHLRQKDRLWEVRIPHEQGAPLAWLHNRGELVSSEENERETILKVRLSPLNSERFKARFSSLQIRMVER